MKRAGHVAAFIAIAAVTGTAVVSGVIVFALWDMARKADDRYSEILDWLEAAP